MNSIEYRPWTPAWLRASILTLVFVTGCATPPVKTSIQAPPGWAERQQTLERLQDWQLSGKLGVRQDDRIDSAIINNWSQQGAHFDIQLSSAVFGLGATAIEGTPEGIRFTRAGEEPLYSDQPETLILQQAGWTLPIHSLFYWIKGIPAPAEVDAIRFDEAGQLHELKQGGWTIRYDEYHAAQPNGRSGSSRLPRKVVLQRDKVRLTLVINNWQLSIPPT